MKKSISKAENKSRNNEKLSKSQKAFKYPEGYKKNLDNIKLLISHPIFQKDIIEIRKYLEIPETGFLNDADKSLAWDEKMTRKSDEIISQRQFFNQEDRIREKYRVKEISYGVAQEQMRLLWHKTPINFLTDSTNFLIEKFNLPLNYDNFIRSYIIGNTINKLYIPPNNFVFGGTGYPSDITPWKARFASIVIYAKLTDKELIDLKKQIDFFGKRLPDFQPLKNIDKKLTIERWLLNREIIDEVTYEKTKVKVEDIAKEVLGSKKKTKQVYEAKRELKELREKRFGK